MADMTIYSKELYIAALRWFGFADKQAERNYRERKRNGNLYGINDIVQDYKAYINRFIDTRIGAFWNDSEIIEALLDRFTRDELEAAGYADFIKPYFEDGEAEA